MPTKSDEQSDDLEETWPAIMRIGTVARYLDCSVTTVNKMISEGAFPAIKYGPRESMRGVRRQEVDTYIESLNPEFDYPVFEWSDINDTSLVLQVAYGPTSFLFTGDATSHAEQAMVTAGEPLSATILKVGHHGSHTSTKPEFLRAVQPQVAVYSAGTDNPYGHPHQSTLDALARAHVAVYGTDVNGSVIVTTDNHGYAITASRVQTPRSPFAPAAPEAPTWTATAQVEDQITVTVTQIVQIVRTAQTTVVALNRRTATALAKQTAAAEKIAKRTATVGTRQTSVAKRTATVVTRRTATVAARQTATAERVATRSTRSTRSVGTALPKPAQMERGCYLDLGSRWQYHARHVVKVDHRDCKRRGVDEETASLQTPFETR